MMLITSIAILTHKPKRGSHLFANCVRKLIEIAADASLAGKVESVMGHQQNLIFTQVDVRIIESP